MHRSFTRLCKLSILILLGSILSKTAIAKTAVSTWVYSDRSYRLAVTVQANGFERLNKVVELPIDFSEQLTNLGASDNFDESSLRVAEVTADGNLLHDEVPFQFDNGEFINEPNGTLLWLMDGSTAVNESRHYQIYFDSVGTYTPPAPMIDRVIHADTKGYRGQQSFVIETMDDASTINAAYYYHREGGAFASIYDRNGNDWVGYYNTDGSESGGEYRGLPNLGDVFHPGFEDGKGSTSHIIEDGPIRLTILTQSIDKKWTATWDIYPTYAQMTLLTIPENRSYWFLYEGTPGGNLEYTGKSRDMIIRSDGAMSDANETWDLTTQELESTSPSIPGEWVYFADSTVDRMFFLAHSNDDLQPDSYRRLFDEGHVEPRDPPSDNGAMTVFGFGRRTDTMTKFLTAVDATFTIGFGESKVHSDATETIFNATQDVLVTIDNEPPSGAGAFEVAEAGTIILTANDVAGNDPEGGWVQFQILTLPEEGELILDTVPLAVGQQFSTDDLSNGRVSYRHDGGNDPFDNFRVTPFDHQKSGESFTVSITILIETLEFYLPYINR